MRITVKLFAGLRTNNKKELFLNIMEGATPRDIIRQLNISEKDATIIMINGRNRGLDTVLYEGDTVSIFPPVGGG